MTILDIYRSGNTYYGSYGRSSDLFATLWNLVQGDALAGDTIRLAGNTLYEALGTLNHKSEVNLSSSGKLSGGTIDWTNSTLPEYGRALNCSGGVLSYHSLQSDAIIGDNRIVVTDPAGIIAGDLLLIGSLAVWKNNERNQKQGELRYVSHVDGNVITLTEPLEDTYLAVNAQGDTIRRLNPIKNIVFNGVRFIDTKMGRNLSGPLFYYGANIRVTNCFLSQIEESSVNFWTIRDGRVDNNYIEKSWMKGQGYGVSFGWACYNLLVDLNEIQNCRHNTAIGGGGGGGAYGVARHLKYEHNTSRDSIWWDPTTGTFQNGEQMDCHNVGEDIQFNYNDLSGRGDGLGGYGAYTVQYYKNVCHDLTGQGIGVCNPFAERILIQENTIRNTGYYGIVLGAISPALSTKNVIVYKNDISNTTYDGIIVIDSSGTRIQGNKIRGATRYGILLYGTTKGTRTYENDLVGAGALALYQDEGTNNIHYNNLGLNDDIPTRKISYSSTPIPVDATINDFIIPSGGYISVLDGEIVVLKFPIKVVV